MYGRLLGPFLDDPTNLFVISSDFCHWGQRFGFTYYDTQKHVSYMEVLTHTAAGGWLRCMSTVGLLSWLQGSISRSIQWLDNVAMDIIEQVWLTTPALWMGWHEVCSLSVS